MSEKALYKLKRAYWDGRKLHEAGSQLYFAEGEAPPTAVKQDAPEAFKPSKK